MSEQISWFGRIMLAAARISVGVMFFFFGQYKIASPAFVHGGFEHSIREWINQGQPAHWLVPVLRHVVLSHPVLWGRIIAWSEMLIAISLLLGLWVRWASIGGTVFMLSLALCTWYAAGYPAPKWQFIAAHLPQFPLLLLFLLFWALRAGETLGLDGIWPFRRK